MGKRTISITIDDELIQKARKSGLFNLSGYLNDCLKNYIDQQNTNINGINERILTIEILQMEEKQQKIAQNLQKSREILEKIKEKKAENEKKRLEKEKEIRELSTTCLNCGKILEEKDSIKFPKGKVCRACYAISGKDNIKRWIW